MISNSRMVSGLLLSAALCRATSALAGGGCLEMRQGYFWDPQATHYFVPVGMSYQLWNSAVGANQSYEQVRYDFEEMKKMHVNSVRVELPWGMIETAPGNYNWANADALMDIADQVGLKLFVLIGFQYPPGWAPSDWFGINENYAQSQVVNYRSDNARAGYSNYIAAVTGRYRDRTCVAGWILGNEYAFYDLWETADPHVFLGYDDASKWDFRYFALYDMHGGSIADLNAAWGTAYTNVADIVMPARYPSNRVDAAYHDLLQWRKKVIGEYVAVGSCAARAADTNHLRTYSMVGGIFNGNDCNISGEDPKTIVAQCAAKGAPLDFWAINNYPWVLEGNEMRMAQFGITKIQDQSGLPVLISETGISSTDNLFPDAGPRQAGALAAHAWEALMRGAIGVHLFHWNDREWFTPSFSRERGFGITTGNRIPKQPVYDNIVAAYRQLRNMNADRLFGGSTNPAGNIAVYWGVDADMGWNRANEEMSQIWGALKRLGYEPRFMDEGGYDARRYTNANYRALVVSRAYQMSSNRLAQLTNVVAQGKHVYANADIPGQYNAYHQVNGNWNSVIQNIFGLTVSAATDPWHGAVSGSWESKFSHARINNVITPLGALTNGYHLETGLGAWHLYSGVAAHSGATVIQTVGYPDSSPTWFNITPLVTIAPTNPAEKVYIFPDYRHCTNGSVLLSLHNGHNAAAAFTVAASNLLYGRTVENLTDGGILETNSDGQVTLALGADAHVVLYAYATSGGVDASVINPATAKLWFREAPLAGVWPNGTNWTVNLGYDTRGANLNLKAAFERDDGAVRVFGTAAVVAVTGQGHADLGVFIPDADLNNPDYVSTADGASYRWHAWLESGGAPVYHLYLPTRLYWGARPTAALPNVQTGQHYNVAIQWQCLPSYETWLYPAPLDRAGMWDISTVTAPGGDEWHPKVNYAQSYDMVLELMTGATVVASSTVTTTNGTATNVFSITAPAAGSGFAWRARAVTKPSGFIDFTDNFENRKRMWENLTLPPFTAVEPWIPYAYAQYENPVIADGGDGIAGTPFDPVSDGTNSLCLTAKGYWQGDWGGFGIERVWPQTWELPADTNQWTNIIAAFDFLDATSNKLWLVEMELKLVDENGNGLSYVAPHNRTPGQWDTNRANLKQFSHTIPAQPWFDRTKVKKFQANIRIPASLTCPSVPTACTWGVQWKVYFDRMSFTGADTLCPRTNWTFAIYDSRNDSPAADSDGDGILDVYETNTGVYQGPTDTGTDPHNPDSDGDRMSDGEEVIAGTDPNVAGDYFHASGVQRNAPAGGMVIEWFAHTGRIYGVYYRTNLNSGGLAPLGAFTNIVVAAAGATNVVDSSIPSAMKLYQVRVRQP